ncbi:MAG: DUF4412 domain-containing protein [Candidatus Eisenbacteria bacterium]|nr:DUF4412 domain-containing protein [Candidatus Latescibacterota bacterium]MBD3302405.1 DUF4412 domain-containing protein [Candidatus Eisenbacteria bacterium]
MQRITIFLAAGLLLVAFAGSAGADLTVRVEQDGETNEMVVTDHRFRVEHEQGLVIFRGDRDLLWVVQSAKGEYLELTEKDMEDLAAKMDGAMAEMEEALKNLPPEQRAMAEKMMAGKLPPEMTGASEKRTVEEMGQSRKINGFQTSGYRLLRDGKPAAEVWAASPGDLGLEKKDVAVFEEFGAFMKTAVPGMESLADRYAMAFEDPGEGEVPGFPILRIEKNESGEEIGRTEVVAIDRGEVAETLFELPEGLEKAPFQIGGPGN